MGKPSEMEQLREEVERLRRENALLRHQAARADAFNAEELDRQATHTRRAQCGSQRFVQCMRARDQRQPCFQRVAGPLACCAHARRHACVPHSSQPRRRDDELSQLHGALAAKQQQCDDLQALVDGARHACTQLHSALQEEAAHRQQLAAELERASEASKQELVRLLADVVRRSCQVQGGGVSSSRRSRSCSARG